MTVALFAAVLRAGQCLYAMLAYSTIAGSD